MELSEIQRVQQQVIEEMKWERFNATQVFSHLIEELGEIVRYFLYEEEYKVKGAGHIGVDGDIEQEFAQAFNLLLQLANFAGVDLEKAWLKEREEFQKRFNPEQWRKLAEEVDKKTQE